MLVSLILRVCQLLFAAVVLALSVVLVHGYGPGHAPSLLDYGVFCGAGALIFAAVGVLALFLEPLQGIIMLALDGVASFFLLAGAAAFSAKIRSGSCTNGYYIADILGTINTSPYKFYAGNGDQQIENAAKDLENRCRIAQTDEAFLWIVVICFIATAVLGFLGKSGKRGATY
ncbi:uncharacterized protein LY89DRAFT_674271 [Mollisia scopiformis]|uniref:MARVEL domain-containing protein n=1 Tax=Mollisia scopiformis TaxID=149040 RepID=A0A194WUR5_MOLSC|nr:uncharacterized protein LY89DRAFT_674271 [Mollisia scopiformis]KUJ11706.1 hypothetical protein LY89DRAFT_674271 [Mollisia scopiformis]